MSTIPVNTQTYTVTYPLRILASSILGVRDVTDPQAELKLKGYLPVSHERTLNPSPSVINGRRLFVSPGRLIG